MKAISAFFFFGIILSVNVCAQQQAKFFDAANDKIRYTGRVDFSNSASPRFWAAGVYLTTSFYGNYCDIIVNDEMPSANSHNYLEIVVDGKAKRIKLKQARDTVHAEAEGGGAHSLLICKDTEASIGYLEFVGLRCENLADAPPAPTLKMEFIGDSITSGASNDLSEIPCKTAEWYDQNNAWESYGAITARMLNAQWHLSSVSGIGLVHSCCGRNVYMPDVYTSVNFGVNHNDPSKQWDFQKYRPDIVTVCLGQNDGVQDSVKFCDAYVAFIKKLHEYHPGAEIVCLNSPMAGNELNTVLKKYITAIAAACKMNGHEKVHSFFFTKKYNAGCGGHPDVSEDRQIAIELSDYIKTIKIR